MKIGETMSGIVISKWVRDNLRNVMEDILNTKVEVVSEIHELGGYTFRVGSKLRWNRFSIKFRVVKDKLDLPVLERLVNGQSYGSIKWRVRSIYPLKEVVGFLIEVEVVYIEEVV